MTFAPLAQAHPCTFLKEGAVNLPHKAEKALCALLCGGSILQEIISMKKGIEVEAFYCKENCNKKEKGKIQFNYDRIPLSDKAKIYVKKDATYLQPQIKIVMPNETIETLFIMYTTDIDNVLETLKNGPIFKYDDMMFTWWSATNEKDEELFIRVYFDNNEKNVILKIVSKDTLVVEFSQDSAKQIIKSLVE